MGFTISPDLLIVLEFVFAAMAWTVMGARLWLRKHRRQPFCLSDYVTMICMVSLLLTVSLIAAYEKSNINSLLPTTPHDLAIARRATRIYATQLYAYIIYLWGQKSVVLLFIQRVWGGLPWPRVWIRLAWAYIALTFVFAIVAWSVSCRGPAYNIVLTGRPPAHCLNDAGSLYTYVALNTSTDLLLILLPIPWLVQVHRPWSTRLLLVGLFSIGLLIAAASLSRAFLTTTNNGINSLISLFELLLSALAANLPTLYSLRRRKPQAPSPPDPECSMPPPQPPQPWARPRVLSDTQIIADSGDTDTETQSDHRNTRVSSQASTEPLFRRELYL
ncbi:hypothetical protein BP00DRAFT_441865 [Aspergillus indologenus CBS 114.80]|uniref:Rhodopsin domain-containing protein n=1 Tax=Aspergillus indologenus CBS 114.80 TaxID=1450541 RepID=A0A2V5IJH4_9EURO|nr:hypothetical protein BP00DRAFT_441865 [Aspergillus indologenus CBS 114.80]